MLYGSALTQGDATPGVCCPLRMLHREDAAPKGSCTQRILHPENAAPRGCCTRSVLHRERAAPRECCTQRVLHPENAAPRGCCTRRMLHPRVLHLENAKPIGCCTATVPMTTSSEGPTEFFRSPLLKHWKWTPRAMLHPEDVAPKECQIQSCYTCRMHASHLQIYTKESIEIGSWRQYGLPPTTTTTTTTTTTATTSTITTTTTTTTTTKLSEKQLIWGIPPWG